MTDRGSEEGRTGQEVQSAEHFNGQDVLLADPAVVVLASVALPGDLFQQATDTRPAELQAQGVRPRVWFGERWITSVFDLFEENARYFPAMLPEVDDEDPQAAFDAGRTPKLAEMRLQRMMADIFKILTDAAGLQMDLPGMA